MLGSERPESIIESPSVNEALSTFANVVRFQNPSETVLQSLCSWKLLNNIRHVNSIRAMRTYLNAMDTSSWSTGAANATIGDKDSRPRPPLGWLQTCGNILTKPKLAKAVVVSPNGLASFMTVKALNIRCDAGFRPRTRGVFFICQ